MPSAPSALFDGGRRSGLLGEVCWVTAAGIMFALAANWISPRGLSLTREYFPRLAESPVGVGPVPGSSPAGRLQGRGFQLLNGDELLVLFRDPGYALERVVIVDARNDEHYQHGHIPGAFQLDHYRAELYLPVVLPACRTAEKIVVYCTGGDCEDSEYTVSLLVQAGVPKGRLFVYPGGMAEWSARKNPVETGPRHSGIIQPARP